MAEARAVDETQDDIEDAIVDPVDTDAAGDIDAAESGDEGLEAADADEEAGELTISFGDPVVDDAEAGKAAPDWVKDLRESNRRLSQEKADLERKLQAVTPTERAPELPAMPTMESVDYDAEKFATETHAWYAKKATFDEHQEKVKADQGKVQEAWNKQLDGYLAEKEKLKASVPDIEEAHETIKSKLSVVQQSTIVKSKHNAKLVAALYRDPAKLKEIAAITDPLDFAIAIGELGEKIKVTKKSSIPAPEQTGARGSKAVMGAGKGGRSAKEQQLLDQAARTGDASPYIAYKRSLRAQQAGARK